ncbi:response regulator transcription factor [Amycolatopsis sp. NPDC051114]|uniref:response regulator transcription factor n=1 Tax=Amycolatopsis sp. NPDC051114 TaxID=3155280 RepID=UPI003440DECE
MPNLLVVEDDAAIGSVLESTLRLHGHQVCWRRDGRTALQAAETGDFDLVLLDLGLPDLDGVEVCRRLRAALPASVLVILTARQEEMDVVVGLDAGADDYLVKPFEAEELLARLRALGRRDLEGAECLPLGAAALDLQRHEVVLPRGERITLSGREFELLRTLAQRPKAIHPRASLRTNVFADSTGESIVDTYVYYLRRKLGRDVVRTVHGLGYQLGAV